MVHFLLLFCVLVEYFSAENKSLEERAAFLGFIVLVSMASFLWKKRDKFSISFELFLFIFFFISTYVYPIFFYGKIMHPIYDNTIDSWVVRSLYIATFGYFCYVIGALSFSQQTKRKQTYVTPMAGSLVNTRPLVILALLIFVLVLSQGGYEIIFRYSADINTNAQFLFLDTFFYVKILLLVAALYEFNNLKLRGVNSFRDTIRYTNTHFIIVFVVMLIFTFVAGNRTDLIYFGFILLFLYNYNIKRVKPYKAFIFITLSILILSTIASVRSEAGGLTRLSNFNAVSTISIQTIFSDFFAASVDLPLLVQYVEEHGAMMGTNALGSLLSFVPYLQGLVFGLTAFNPPPSSSEFVTDLINGGESGMGTHIIGDVYYGFGFTGTLIIMGLFGMFMQYLYQNRNRCTIYQQAIYISLCANSVFTARVELFYTIRIMGFSIMVILLYKKLFPHKT